MSLVFTKVGAKRLHEDFDKMCKEFAKKNNIEFETSRLTYGERLSFTVKFGLEDNKNEEWDNMVSYFKARGADLQKGLVFKDGRKQYRILGTINPSARSRFKIGVYDFNRDGDTYFAISYLIELLKGAK